MIKIERFSLNEAANYAVTGTGQWTSVRISDKKVFDAIKNHHLAIPISSFQYLTQTSVIYKSLYESFQNDDIMCNCERVCESLYVLAEKTPIIFISFDESV